MFWGGYKKELKDEGRNDTTHNEKIPETSVIAIVKRLAVLQRIMQCCKQKDATKYMQLVKMLPPDDQDQYHRLIQYGAFFIIAMSFARRGREGTSFVNLLSQKMLEFVLLFLQFQWNKIFWMKAKI